MVKEDPLSWETKSDENFLDGYQKMFDILNDPSHRRHKEMKDWVDVNFEPEKIQCPISKMMPKEIE